MTLYLEPVGLLSGDAAQRACDDDAAAWLAGGPLAFSGLHLIERGDGETRIRRMPVAELRASFDSEISVQLDALTAPRGAFAGLTIGADAPPRIMGIVNVTPDSFSDGGAFLAPDRAVAQARGLFADGVDIVDIGGESTRPGAEPVDAATECARVIPVLEALADDDVPLSIDTRRAAVMRAALDAGAAIVNDVTALAGDSESLGVVAGAEARQPVCVVLMHMAGEPRTMQDAPTYDDVVLDVYDALAARVAACDAAGISRDRVCVDPGIGFGKTAAHNLALLDRLALFHGLGCALMVGASRKSFVARVTGDAPADRRLGGSLAAALTATARGCHIVRVHDVFETRQAVALATRIAQGGRWRG